MVKKWLVLFIVVVGSVFGYLTVAHLSGGAFATFGLPLGGERGFLRRQAMAFMEDVQFKDFQAASKYHSPEDQAGVDIPFLIWRLFKVKPEALDLMSYEIVFADLDTSDLRGRVKVRMKAKELVREQIREQEMMLYFFRATPTAPWYMKFEDSLRDPKKDPNKKG